MELAAMAAVLFTAATTQAFLGFGFGIVSMGGLALLFGVPHASGVVNVVGLVLTGSMTVRLFQHVHWRLVGRVFAGALVGLFAGLFLLGRMDLVDAQRLLGFTIAAIAAWNLTPWRPRRVPKPFWDAPVGFVSGVLNGLFNTGGPPVVVHVYVRPWSPDELRGTVQALLFAAGLARLPGAFAVGMITRDVLVHAAIGAGFVAAGMAVGVFISRRVDPARFRSTSWIALTLLGLWIAATAGTG